jgi:hypothetical protein
LELDDRARWIERIEGAGGALTQRLLGSAIKTP